MMVLEVMGRDAGHIALNAGIAGGADVILIPEIQYSLDKIRDKIDSVKREQNRNFSLVVVAEGVMNEAGELLTITDPDGGIRFGGIGHHLGKRITEETGAQTGVTVLDHTQRGGSPTPQDRLFASAFGVHAVDMVAEGKFDRMVTWSNRDCIDVPLADVVDQPHTVDPDGPVVRTARGLGICLGDLFGPCA